MVCEGSPNYYKGKSAFHSCYPEGFFLKAIVPNEKSRNAARLDALKIRNRLAGPVMSYSQPAKVVLIRAGQIQYRQQQALAGGFDLIRCQFVDISHAADPEESEGDTVQEIDRRRPLRRGHDGVAEHAHHVSEHADGDHLLGCQMFQQLGTEVHAGDLSCTADGHRQTDQPLAGTQIGQVDTQEGVHAVGRHPHQHGADDEDQPVRLTQQGPQRFEQAWCTADLDPPGGKPKQADQQGDHTQCEDREKPLQPESFQQVTACEG